MRHRVTSLRLNRKRSHRKSLLRNLVTSFIVHEKIQTTEMRAKALQSFVERLITSTKRKSEREAIRTLQKVVFQKAASEKMVKDLKVRFEKQQSGFTRIIPVGVRGGDGAAMVQIEFIS